MMWILTYSWNVLLNLVCLTIFQTCLTNWTCPMLWKWARVAPFHMKLPKYKQRNYCPVFLLSVVSKIFEEVTFGSSLCYFEENNFLSSRGFWSCSASLIDLLLLTRDWQEVLGSGPITLAVALDIARASNHMWHKEFLPTIKARGIWGSLTGPNWGLPQEEDPEGGLGLANIQYRHLHKDLCLDWSCRMSL